MSSDASSSGSSSPELEILPTRTKGKGKQKQKPRHDGTGKDESSHDPHWAYKAPVGMKVLEDVIHGGEFDWEDLNNADDETEIWIIRVPDSIKPKYLEGLTIELPRTKEQTDRVGTLKRKQHNYDVWSVGQDDAPVGGEELKNISCLLPRKKKKGELQLAPRPVTRHLVLSAQDPIPTTADAHTVHQNPPRPSYPKEVLKHRFMPCGSLAPQEHEQEAGDEEDIMDVDADASDPAVVPVPPSPRVSKKRKSGVADDAEMKKKTKKAKTTKR